MSFYIRKSLKAGPLRFNFSKSGVGVSAGFTGFRIGTGPRGNYIHAGRNGFYYRKTISSKRRPTAQSAITPSPAQEQLPSVSSVHMEEIESGDVLAMQDSSSADLLAEINAKHKKRRVWPFMAVAWCFVLVTYFCVWSLVPSELGEVVSTIFCLGFPLLVVLAGVITFLSYRQDQLSKTVVLFYEFDSDVEQAYQSLHEAFADLASSARAWHTEARGDIKNLQEQKRQAGATTLVKRQPIKLTYEAPPYVSTNLSIPTIPVGRQSLYFFPDRILVYDKGRVGAVSYADIQFTVSDSRFIEEEGVPKDTKIIGQTWKYVNKKGGPDRRFKNNRQIPIVLYKSLHFTSESGLNELIEVSKSDLEPELANAFKALASMA